MLNSGFKMCIKLSQLFGKALNKLSQEEEIMRKILVTGGTTFVSRCTASYFADKGNEVFVLNRNTKSQVRGVNLIEADRNSLGDKLKDYSFDLVIDVCAYTKSDIENLTDALGDFKDYVFISSSAVYPETLPQPFTEEMERGENSVWGMYGVNKFEAEKELSKRVPQAYILRPPYLYGPMQNLYREPFVFDCAELDRTFCLPKDGKMSLQFFHVEDLCRFIEILIKKHPENRIFNVGNRESVTCEDWAELCYKAVGKVFKKQYVDESYFQRDYFPFHDYDYKLNVDKMLSLMPETKDLSEGLKQEYVWYTQNKKYVIKKPLIDFIDKNIT